jgi:hypothetical protein
MAAISIEFDKAPRVINRVSERDFDQDWALK